MKILDDNELRDPNRHRGQVAVQGRQEHGPLELALGQHRWCGDVESRRKLGHHPGQYPDSGTGALGQFAVAAPRYVRSDDLYERLVR